MPFFLSSKPTPKSVARPKLVVKDKTKAQAVPVSSPYAATLLWLCLGLGIGGGLGVGWYFARSALRRQVALKAPVPAGKGSVALAVPEWISPTEAHAIVEGMESCLSTDPLDGGGLADAANVLASQPAVGKVVRLWRGPDGRVQCVADWYAPAGIVVGRGGNPLSVVDIQGHLLAENLPAEAAETLRRARPVPRIEGVEVPAREGGKTWEDPGLQAGLQVLRLLPDALQKRIVTLHVGEWDAQKRLTISFGLETSQGSIDVLWGLPVGAEAGVDAPAADKLKALIILCTDTSVRNGQAGSHFSIRHGRVMVTDIAPPPPAMASPPKAGNGRRP